MNKLSMPAYGYLRSWLLPMALTALLMPSAKAGDDIRSERVQFKRGESSAVIEASITGYEVVDYVLGAGKGQHMNVSLSTDNGANYFNILAPGENEVAMFVGSTSGNQYEGILPASGDYKIRVYMMRSAARRNETARYRLEMIITASEATRASGVDTAASDALLAGTSDHATGADASEADPGAFSASRESLQVEGGEASIAPPGKASIADVLRYE